jgi:multiple sugar transport system permease protein
MPVLMVAVVLRTIDAIGTFDQIYVLTKGGPGTSTQLISIYAYNTAFLFTQYGRAMAMMVALLAFLLILMIVAIRLMRRAAARSAG